MKKLLALVSITFALACSEEDILVDKATELTSVFGVSPSPSPLGGDTLFFENIAYGTAERQQLDILLPPAGSLKGVLIFFHGGGFTGGDKGAVFDDYIKETMNFLLSEKMAIVSANYTLLTTAGNQGVISALEDGTAVINFIEDHRTELDFPLNKVVLAGVSAGAGIAQWNGFKEEINTQVQGVVALAAQSSYNLYEWEKVFPGFSLDDLRRSNPFLDLLFTQFYGGDPTPFELEALDYRGFMDTNDPPLYVLNTAGDEVINAQGEIDFDVLYHSFRHADYLRAKAVEVGLTFSGIYQEPPEQFILRHLE
ncbi:MAG: alpha/beta hydrolase fold domain-containing protein [Flavobacteriaceae bacterium]